MTGDVVFDVLGAPGAAGIEAIGRAPATDRPLVLDDNLNLGARWKA